MVSCSRSQNCSRSWSLRARQGSGCVDFGQNRRRRLTESTIYQEIFDEILLLAVNRGPASGAVLCTDSTHLKANADKNKFDLEQVAVTPCCSADQRAKYAVYHPHGHCWTFIPAICTDTKPSTRPPRPTPETQPTKTRPHHEGWGSSAVSATIGCSPCAVTNCSCRCASSVFSLVCGHS